MTLSAKKRSSRPCIMLYVLAVFTTFLFINSAAVAVVSGPISFCNPSSGGANCVTGYCNPIGATKMESDGNSLLGCLSTVDGNKDCSTGACKWKMIAGGDGGGSLSEGENFGGMYQFYLCGVDNVYYGDERGGCRPGMENPLTGACSCPAGFTAYRANDFRDNGTSCPQNHYDNRGMVQVYCMKKP